MFQSFLINFIVKRTTKREKGLYGVYIITEWNQHEEERDFEI